MPSEGRTSNTNTPDPVEIAISRGPSNSPDDQVGWSSPGTRSPSKPNGQEDINEPKDDFTSERVSVQDEEATQKGSTNEPHINSANIMSPLSAAANLELPASRATTNATQINSADIMPTPSAAENLELPASRATTSEPQINSASTMPPPSSAANLELPASRAPTSEPQIDSANIMPPPSSDANLELPASRATTIEPQTNPANIMPTPSAAANLELSASRATTSEPQINSANIMSPPSAAANLELPASRATTSEPQINSASIMPTPSAAANLELPASRATTSEPQINSASTMPPPSSAANLELPVSRANIMPPPSSAANLELPPSRAITNEPQIDSANIIHPPSSAANIELPPSRTTTIEQQINSANRMSQHSAAANLKLPPSVASPTDTINGIQSQSPLNNNNNNIISPSAESGKVPSPQTISDRENPQRDTVEPISVSSAANLPLPQSRATNTTSPVDKIPLAPSAAANLALPPSPSNNSSAELQVHDAEVESLVAPSAAAKLSLPPSPAVNTTDNEQTASPLKPSTSPPLPAHRQELPLVKSVVGDNNNRSDISAAANLELPISRESNALNTSRSSTEAGDEPPIPPEISNQPLTVNAVDDTSPNGPDMLHPPSAAIKLELPASPAISATSPSRNDVFHTMPVASAAANLSLPHSPVDNETQPPEDSNDKTSITSAAAKQPLPPSPAVSQASSKDLGKTASKAQQQNPTDTDKSPTEEIVVDDVAMEDDNVTKPKTKTPIDTSEKEQNKPKIKNNRERISRATSRQSSTNIFSDLDVEMEELKHLRVTATPEKMKAPLPNDPVNTKSNTSDKQNEGAVDKTAVQESHKTQNDKESKTRKDVEEKVGTEENDTDKIDKKRSDKENKKRDKERRRRDRDKDRKRKSRRDPELDATDETKNTHERDDKEKSDKTKRTDDTSEKRRRKRASDKSRHLKEEAATADKDDTQTFDAKDGKANKRKDTLDGNQTNRIEEKNSPAQSRDGSTKSSVNGSPTHQKAGNSNLLRKSILARLNTKEWREQIPQYSSSDDESVINVPKTPPRSKWYSKSDENKKLHPTEEPNKGAGEKREPKRQVTEDDRNPKHKQKIDKKELRDIKDVKVHESKSDAKSKREREKKQRTDVSERTESLQKPLSRYEKSDENATTLKGKTDRSEEEAKQITKSKNRKPKTLDRNEDGTGKSKSKKSEPSIQKDKDKENQESTVQPNKEEKQAKKSTEKQRRSKHISSTEKKHPEPVDTEIETEQKTHEDLSNADDKKSELTKTKTYKIRKVETIIPLNESDARPSTKASSISEVKSQDPLKEIFGKIKPVSATPTQKQSDVKEYVISKQNEKSTKKVKEAAFEVETGTSSSTKGEAMKRNTPDNEKKGANNTHESNRSPEPVVEGASSNEKIMTADDVAKHEDKPEENEREKSSTDIPIRNDTQSKTSSLSPSNEKSKSPIDRKSPSETSTKPNSAGSKLSKIDSEKKANQSTVLERTVSAPLNTEPTSAASDISNIPLQEHSKQQIDEDEISPPSITKPLSAESNVSKTKQDKIHSPAESRPKPPSAEPKISAANRPSPVKSIPKPTSADFEMPKDTSERELQSPTDRDGKHSATTASKPTSAKTNKSHEQIQSPRDVERKVTANSKPDTADSTKLRQLKSPLDSDKETTLESNTKPLSDSPKKQSKTSEEKSTDLVKSISRDKKKSKEESSTIESNQTHETLHHTEELVRERSPATSDHRRNSSKLPRNRQLKSPLDNDKEQTLESNTQLQSDSSKKPSKTSEEKSTDIAESKSREEKKSREASNTIESTQSYETLHHTKESVREKSPATSEHRRKSVSPSQSIQSKQSSTKAAISAAKKDWASKHLDETKSKGTVKRDADHTDKTEKKDKSSISQSEELDHSKISKKTIQNKSNKERVNDKTDNKSSSLKEQFVGKPSSAKMKKEKKSSDRPKTPEKHKIDSQNDVKDEFSDEQSEFVEGEEGEVVTLELLKRRAEEAAKEKSKKQVENSQTTGQNIYSEFGQSNPGDHDFNSITSRVRSSVGGRPTASARPRRSAAASSRPRRSGTTSGRSQKRSFDDPSLFQYPLTYTPVEENKEESDLNHLRNTVSRLSTNPYRKPEDRQSSIGNPEEFSDSEDEVGDQKEIFLTRFTDDDISDKDQYETNMPAEQLSKQVNKEESKTKTKSKSRSKLPWQETPPLIRNEFDLSDERYLQRNTRREQTNPKKPDESISKLKKPIKSILKTNSAHHHANQKASDHDDMSSIEDNEDVYNIFSIPKKLDKKSPFAAKPFLQDQNEDDDSDYRDDPIFNQAAFANSANIKTNPDLVSVKSKQTRRKPKTKHSTKSSGEDEDIIKKGKSKKSILKTVNSTRQAQKPVQRRVSKIPVRQKPQPTQMRADYDSESPIQSDDGITDNTRQKSFVSFSKKSEQPVRRRKDNAWIESPRSESRSYSRHRSRSRSKDRDFSNESSEDYYKGSAPRAAREYSKQRTKSTIRIQSARTSTKSRSRRRRYSSGSSDEYSDDPTRDYRKQRTKSTIRIRSTSPSPSRVKSKGSKDKSSILTQDPQMKTLMLLLEAAKEHLGLTDKAVNSTNIETDENNNQTINNDILVSGDEEPVDPKSLTLLKKSISSTNLKKPDIIERDDVSDDSPIRSGPRHLVKELRDKEDFEEGARITSTKSVKVMDRRSITPNNSSKRTITPASFQETPPRTSSSHLRVGSTPPFSPLTPEGETISMGYLKDHIKNILPSLGRNDLHHVTQKLFEMGVETMYDLELIEKEDLEKTRLNSIQARKLLTSWKPNIPNGGRSVAGSAVELPTDTDHLPAEELIDKTRWLKFNIGGVMLETTRDTVDRLKSPFLALLLDPDSEDVEPPPDGIYRIDRNPEAFQILLDYARYGKIVGNPELLGLDFLLEEIDYYKMDRTVTKCITDYFDEKKKAPKAGEIEVEKISITEMSMNKQYKHHNSYGITNTTNIACYTSVPGGKGICHTDVQSLFLYETAYLRFPALFRAPCLKCGHIVCFADDPLIGTEGWCHKCHLCLRCQDILCEGTSDEGDSRGHQVIQEDLIRKTAKVTFMQTRGESGTHRDPYDFKSPRGGNLTVAPYQGGGDVKPASGKALKFKLPKIPNAMDVPKHSVRANMYRRSSSEHPLSQSFNEYGKW